jgi:hypothetical protein
MIKKITNEVLCERLDNLIRDNSEDHAKIIIQTTKTNGIVTKHDNWLNRIIGALIVSNAVVLPILLYLLFKYVI